MDPNLFLILIIKFYFIWYFSYGWEVTGDPCSELVFVSAVVVGRFICPFINLEEIQCNVFLFIEIARNGRNLSTFRLLMVDVLAVNLCRNEWDDFLGAINTGIDVAIGELDDWISV